MLLKYLKYRYVKARMTAYLDGELSIASRRFIARQIDENQLCYQEYIRARQTKQELERTLPAFGQAQSGQLADLWANIQTELNQPEQAAENLIPRPNYSLSYSVAVLALAIMMLTPFGLNVSQSGHIPAQDQPMPESTTAVTSPAALTPEAIATSIAYAAETTVRLQSTNRAQIPLHNTPAPRTPGS